ncbi:putative F0F1-ATPase subunit Ca2+/Mg2+ transporter [anaerobic digester metagenome]|jgi:hypothetical protein
MPRPNNNKENGNPLASYARYSAIALQMGVIIAAGVFGGFKTDQLLKLKFPVFTVFLSLLAVGGAIWLLVKEVNYKDKER